MRPSTLTPREAAAAGWTGGLNVHGTRVELAVAPLRYLIATAYRIEVERVSGPDWIGVQRFDVQGRMPEGTAKEQVRAD